MKRPIVPIIVTCFAAAAAMSAACNSDGRGHPRAVNGLSGTPYRGKILVNVNDEGLALEGHDPVAFFSGHAPVKGDRRFESAYKGAIYRFASAEHKAAFDADPARYEPQFGGWCGYAASINKISPVDVNYAEIVEGRLVLQHNQRAWDLWHKDVAGNLRKADANWPGLVEANGR